MKKAAGWRACGGELQLKIKFVMLFLELTRTKIVRIP